MKDNIKVISSRDKKIKKKPRKKLKEKTERNHWLLNSNRKRRKESELKGLRTSKGLMLYWREPKKSRRNLKKNKEKKKMKNWKNMMTLNIRETWGVKRGKKKRKKDRLSWKKSKSKNHFMQKLKRVPGMAVTLSSARKNSKTWEILKTKN